MKRYDFTQLGGFPLTQDRLKWMQEGYIDAINALASVTETNVPIVLTGVELINGGWVNGEVSDGWVYDPVHGVMPFIGGAFTSSNRSYEVSDITNVLVYNNNVSNAVEINRVMQIASGSQPSIKTLSEMRYVDALLAGENNWSTVNAPDDGVVTGAVLRYKINEKLKQIVIRGIFKYHPASYMGGVPPIIERVVFKNLPLPKLIGRSITSTANVSAVGSFYGVSAYDNNVIFTHAPVMLLANNLVIDDGVIPLHPDGVRLLVKMPPPQEEVNVSFDFTINY